MNFKTSREYIGSRQRNSTKGVEETCTTIINFTKMECLRTCKFIENSFMKVYNYLWVARSKYRVIIAATCICIHIILL